MIEIQLSKAAKADLIDIWTETFRKWGPGQADTYMDDIDRALGGLIDNPRTGSDCSDLLMGTRRLIIGRHAGFYEVDESASLVIRILHPKFSSWSLISADFGRCFHVISIR